MWNSSVLVLNVARGPLTKGDACCLPVVLQEDGNAHFFCGLMQARTACRGRPRPHLLLLFEAGKPSFDYWSRASTTIFLYPPPHPQPPFLVFSSSVAAGAATGAPGKSIVSLWLERSGERERPPSRRLRPSRPVEGRRAAGIRKVHSSQHHIAFPPGRSIPVSPIPSFMLIPSPAAAWRVQ